MTTKPTWWPKNPYPESIFPMTESKYADIVPSPELRTALSGMLGRRFWEIASDDIWEAWQAASPEKFKEFLKEIVENNDWEYADGTSMTGDVRDLIEYLG